MMPEKKILDDYLEFVTYGFTNPMPDSAEGPWKITAKDVINGEINFETARKTTQEAFDTKLTKKSRPKIGDVLLTKDGTLGRLAIVQQENICINQSVAVLRPNKKILPEYLFYLLSTPDYQRKMISDSDGTVIKHIYITRVGKMEVDIPSIEEQKKILKHLLAVDGKIKLNTQTNQTLEQIAQAIFKSWFVDFDPVKAKIAVLEAGGTAEQAELAAMLAISAKDEAALKQLQAEQPEAYAELAQTAALFPSAMVDSELGEIPEGWDVTKVEYLLTRLKPKRTYTKKQVAQYGSVPVFDQGAGILLGFHNDEAGFQATPEEPIFIFGDHTCITHLSCTKFDISSNVIPLKGAIRPTVWTFYAILDKQTFQEYRRHWSELIVKESILPPTHITERFSEIATTFYLQTEAHNKEIADLKQVRDSLLPKLLSGELPIPETDEASA